MGFPCNEVESIVQWHNSHWTLLMRSTLELCLDLESPQFRRLWFAFARIYEDAFGKFITRKT